MTEMEKKFRSETREEFSRRVGRAIKKREANVEKHQPVVTDVERNGMFMRVEWTRENGERVIGEFKLIGWARAPADVVADTMERLANPPTFVVGTRGRGQGSRAE